MAEVTCITPGCTNPRFPKRRICNQCRNHQNGEAAKRKRRTEKVKRAKLGPCGPTCQEWRRCTEERLWVDGPLPCEAMLDFEVGVEFDTSEPSYWVIPLTAVRVVEVR